MIIGLGTDIVETQRILDVLDRLGTGFAQRILTDFELQEFSKTKQQGTFLAKRFCVKEAASKALGTGIGRGVSWQHIQIEHLPTGAPLLKFSGGAQLRFAELGGRSTWVSVSDEKHYVTATVVLESCS